MPACAAAGGKERGGGPFFPVHTRVHCPLLPLPAVGVGGALRACLSFEGRLRGWRITNFAFKRYLEGLGKFLRGCGSTLGFP